MPLKVTLEELYTGVKKQMAVTRKVIDRQSGVQTCSGCNGRGVKVDVGRMGPVQQMQSTCGLCGGHGKSFKTQVERELVDVHVQRGSPDRHRVVVREKADEHPDGDTGDVVFVLEEQEHAVFKRRSADLFIERSISFVEALCGFEMGITHLDGRKLLVKTSPGEIVKPLVRGFDPYVSCESKMEWEVYEDCDCPNIHAFAQSDSSDIDSLKNAFETQLQRKGIDVGAFVVRGGRTFFKTASREEVFADKRQQQGCTMYVLADRDAASRLRRLKAVKDEGMPTYKNPFVHGNLFLVLTVQFPESLTVEAQCAMRKLLPPALNKRQWTNDADLQVHVLTNMDPVHSYNSNKRIMQVGGDSHDEDEARGGVQCQQM